MILASTGLNVDVVDRLRLRAAGSAAEPPYTCIPRLGHYIVFDATGLPGHSARTPLLTRPIQPLPTQDSKGVFVYSSLYGHIIVGPTSFEAPRDVPATSLQLDKAIVQYLTERAVKVMHNVGVLCSADRCMKSLVITDIACLSVC